MSAINLSSFLGGAQPIAPVSTYNKTSIFNQSEIEIWDYSQASVLLITSEEFGHNFSYKLKEVAKYGDAFTLPDRQGKIKGWITAKSKYPQFQTLLGSILNGTVPAKPPAFLQKDKPSLIPSITQSMTNIQIVSSETPNMVNLFTSLLPLMREPMESASSKTLESGSINRVLITGPLAEVDKEMTRMLDIYPPEVNSTNIELTTMGFGNKAVLISYINV